MNIAENAYKLVNLSEVATFFIIYCHCECLPLGGAVIKESVFWLINPLNLVAYSKTLYSAFPELC